MGRNHRRSAAMAVVAGFAVAGLAACSVDDGYQVSTTELPATEAAQLEVASAGPMVAGEPGSLVVEDGFAGAYLRPGLPDASTSPSTGSPGGSDTALLHEVRVARNEGFDRIVFEFAGEDIPGYRVEWVDVVPTAAVGRPEVTGSVFLSIELTPASGFDVERSVAVYEGPDRLEIGEDLTRLRSLLRTEDFDRKLRWIAGATEQVPFRVFTLPSPSRLVVDLEAP